MPASGAPAAREPDPGPHLAIDPARFDLVILDCDGVVVDSEMVSCTILRRQLARHGMEIDLDGIFQRFLGRGFKAVAEEYARRLGHPVPDALVADLKAELFAALARELRPMQGVIALIGRLPVPYCLTSASIPERIALSLRVTGLAATFGDRVYDSSMVARGKPAPDLFLHAAARMGAAPARTLVIEDTASGIEAARAAGMTAWAFVGGCHYAGRDGAAILAPSRPDAIFADMNSVRTAARPAPWR